MLEGKIVVPTTEDAKRLKCFGIEEKFGKDFERISDILRPHSVTLAKSFLLDYFKHAEIEHTQEFLDSQIEKTAGYTRDKYTPPINGEWIRRIEKMGALQYKIGAPLFINLAALNNSHRVSAELIFNGAQNEEEGRRLVDLFLRIAGLEAEIMVSTIQRLEKEAFAAAMRKTAQVFEDTVGTTIETSSEQSAVTKEKSGKVADAADTLLALASEVAAASSQSTSAMTDAARMSGSLNATIEQIDNELRASFDSFDSLSQTADEAVASASQLTEHSKSIENIVKLIRDIADQTSILALNALIEAAQAGKAGAGFAVVANEMKALASQTETATQDIAEQLGGIGETTSQSIAANRSMAEQFSMLRESASKLQQRVGEQSSSVTAIAACIDETAQSAEATAEAVEEISRRAGDVARDVGEVSESVVALDSNLRDLKTSADAFAEQMNS
ncbi:Methyl-accepting chemotaxis protein (MCP) signalling domain-containing protein [Altererythrobacter xiamenensis]|uniref:Methyl-accepting chemotaxis protein (MCP) signalling domain-containing protein n=1 Tax=Altererythrobacter xiamenensis TaxID=1316679 RepID=A0A1Y6F1J8_9SPHN|nr:methyl-accepting chemotaxis protein [Altererythrobacter xiamenensis]SMQ68768.1 Methyl-accepting chemotaxis protein (MCP) signalling domain-containing protein [Altererythrobacter xiamenensis]